MPCKCGQKVDRQETSKILCKSCKQFSHCSCYNIKQAELVFVKYNFKCNICARRSSVSSLPADSVVVAIDNEHYSSDVVVAVTDNVQCSNMESVVFSELDSKSDGCTVISASKPVSEDVVGLVPNIVVDIANVAECAPTLSPDKADMQPAEDAVHTNNSNISLDNIYKELVMLNNNNSILNDIVMSLREDNIALKNSNRDLNKLVLSLRDDNLKLLTKVEALTNLVSVHNCSSHSFQSAVMSNANKKKHNNTNGKAVMSKVAVDGLNAANSSSAELTHVNVDKVVVGNNLNNSGALLAQSFAAVARLPNSELPVTTETSTYMKLPPASADVDLQENLDHAVLGPVITAPVPALHNFVTVQRKPKKKPVIVGLNECDELEVFKRSKWVHISSFKSSVSCDDIVSYVAKHSGILSKHIVCFRLVKKDVDISTLKFVNFKLGVSECFYDKLFDTTLWPSNVRVRPFRFLDKSPNLDQAQ